MKIIPIRSKRTVLASAHLLPLRGLITGLLKPRITRWNILAVSFLAPFVLSSNLRTGYAGPETGP